MEYLNGKPVTKERLLTYRDELKKERTAHTVNGAISAINHYPDLVHLFARCYYKRTNNIVELADLLGHSSIETTRIYLKTSMEEQIKKAQKETATKWWTLWKSDFCTCKYKFLSFL